MTKRDESFQDFDRSLHDLRGDVAVANLTLRGVVPRYVAMMDVLETAFLLYYGDMTVEEQDRMKAAFDKLAGIVADTRCLTTTRVKPLRTV
jgi:hypothetical protein